MSTSQIQTEVGVVYRMPYGHEILPDGWTEFHYTATVRDTGLSHSGNVFIRGDGIGAVVRFLNLLGEWSRSEWQYLPKTV